MGSSFTGSPTKGEQGRCPASGSSAVDGVPSVMFDRHGQAAYRMALAMLSSPDAARRVVVASFAPLDRDESVALRPGVAGLGGLAADLYGNGVVVRALTTASNGLTTSEPAETSGPDGRLWAALPVKTRDVVALAMFGGCRSSEIAELVRIDRTDVHRRLTHGLKHLALMRATTGLDSGGVRRGARFAIRPSSVVDGDDDRDGRDGTVVVICAGELDGAVTKDLADALAVAVDLRPAGVVVKMHDVTFFDASVIGAFVQARTAATECGATFELTGVSWFGERVLGAMGLAGMAIEAQDGSTRTGAQDSARTVASRAHAPYEHGSASVRRTADLGDAARERFVIEQAKGILAHQLAMSIDRAGTVLHDYAQRHHVTVFEVADRLTARSLDVGALTHDIVDVSQRGLESPSGSPHGT